jgi:hypothetical protein
MLIPTNYNRLPSVEGCFNGAVIMGGTVAQLAGGLAQLSNAKFLGEAHYNVSHSLYGRYGYSSLDGGVSSIQSLASYKSLHSYFLYQSTALSERLAIVINYSAMTLDDTPNIKISLRPSTGNSYSVAPVDVGIEFSNDVHIESDLTGTERVKSLFTGCELIDAPTNTTPDLPRPLYVPSANRGELLIVDVEVSAVAIASIHIYDIFEGSVTP